MAFRGPPNFIERKVFVIRRWLTGLETKGKVYAFFLSSLWAIQASIELLDCLCIQISLYAGKLPTSLSHSWLRLGHCKYFGGLSLSLVCQEIGTLCWPPKRSSLFSSNLCSGSKFQMFIISLFSFLFQDIPCGKDPLDHGATEIVKMEGGKHSIEVNSNFLPHILFLFQNFHFCCSECLLWGNRDSWKGRGQPEPE